MKRIMTRLSLAGAGALAGAIGGALMFAPKTFLSMSQIIVERDPSLMSEVTAPSGVLLVSGALMILGAIKLRFAGLALFTGAIVSGSYGVARVVSMALHGLPSDTLIGATVLEFAIAIALGALGITAHSNPQGSDAGANLPQLNL